MRAVSLFLVFFLGVHTLGPVRGFGPRLAFADSNPPPLPVAEDPLSAQTEGQHPEISVNVDTRDGHLTVSVVDNWGPGKTPFLYRTYNSTTPATETSAAGAWQLNQVLEIRNVTETALQLREPDGSLSTYTKTGTRVVGTDTYYIYSKEVGTYSTIETIVNTVCTPGDAECELSWSGVYVQYLPKGATRRFVATGAGGPVPPPSAGIVEARDANGNVTTYVWSAPIPPVPGYLQTVTDPIGRVTTYGYETSWCEPGGGPCHKRVKTITDSYGRVVTFTYGGGQLTSSQNAAGAVTTYAQPGLSLTSVTNALGRSYTFTWLTTGGILRIWKVTAPDTKVTTYAYVALPPNWNVTQTTVTDARNNATIYRFNSSGDVTSVTDALNGLTSYTYDTHHNVTQVTNARGIITTYQYNGRNKVTRVVQNVGGLALTTTLTWDSNDNLLSVTNTRGIITAYQYNATHNLTSVTKAQGTPAQSLTQYTYTTWGGVASVIDPRGKTTIFAYDTRRRLTTVDPPAGGNTTYVYNTLDDRTSMTNGNGRTWTFTYDTARNLLTETDPRSNRTSSLYDAVGNRTRVTDPRNFPTNFTYDTRDRITTITDPLSQSTTYLYDAVGNLTRITNARGYATNFAYDALNRLSSVTDALGRATTYQYDAVGNRTQMVDRKGQTFTYTNDAVDRLTQVQVGSTVFSYTYDAAGNRLTLTDGTGTTTFQYDELDRLTRMTYPDTKAVIYTYDAASNRLSLTNPANVLFTYVYDDANRLTQIRQGGRTWALNYDAAGNRTSLLHPNGARINYTYLTNNWLATITHKQAGGVTFETLTYGYDANGNRTTLTDATGTTAFGYDELNRLTSGAYPGGYGTWSWTYDAVGNRFIQNSPSGQTTYGYDANNRLTQAGSTTYSYDNNGNLTSISGGTSFTYDAHNRMSQANFPGGLVVQYTYNGDGLKIRRIEGAATTRYYCDGIRPIYEAKADGSRNADLERDIFGNLLARQDAAGTRYYYHHDGLGSMVGLTESSGVVAAQRWYDAWGNSRASSGSAPGNYRFTGAELDPTSGLYHMGARFYDPTIGRWLSEDPVQDRHFRPAALNFYSYAFANPVRLIDPSGMEPPSGPTPEGIERAAAALQEFINANVDLQSLVEMMLARGIMRITVGGQSISLAQLQQLTIRAPTRADIARMYVNAAILAGAAVVFGLGGIGLIITAPPLWAAIGVQAIMFAGITGYWGYATAAHATMLDIQYYGGNVFWNDLSPGTQHFIISLGLPHPPRPPSP
jgi:RHS repeat-associated protein